MNCSSPQPSSREVAGHVPQRPHQCDIHGEFHWAVSVLPVMLQESGESDLLGKLEEHKLQQKVGCDLGQRSRPAPDGAASAREPKIASEISVAVTATETGHRYQRTRTASATGRPSRHTGVPRNAAVTRNAASPTPSDPPTFRATAGRKAGSRSPQSAESPPS